jgi:hypothetical protein
VAQVGADDLEAHRQRHAGGRGDDAAERRLQGGHGVEVEVRDAQRDEDRQGHEQQAGEGRERTGQAAEVHADVDRHVHLIRTGEQAADGERAEELLVVQPLPLLDDEAAGPRREAAASSTAQSGESRKPVRRASAPGARFTHA